MDPRRRPAELAASNRRAAPAEFTSLLAVAEDVPALTRVMDAAIVELQQVLDDAQIESSRAIMGIDTQLIEDGTYFIVEAGADVAGCSGWSGRATHGSGYIPDRDGDLLDPEVDAARVRAMYTNRPLRDEGSGA